MSVVQIGKEALPEGFMAGNGTVGTSAARLTLAGYTVLKHVIVRAHAGNGNTITVGPTEATASAGFILAAGEQTPPIYVEDTGDIWLIGGAADQDYSWISN